MTESALYPLEKRLLEIWPPAEWRDVTVLLAVSGGADSVAMFRAVQAIKSQGLGRVCVAHFNHKLRLEADEDQRFVEELCQGDGVQCEIGRCDRTSFSGQGIEETARRLRYIFLKETAGRLGARFVVTAHTADDQAETILHRIVRGTGIVGLAGMSRSRPFGPATLLRPLLSVRHSELLKYLSDLGQAFCEDASNTDRRFTRNRIRHDLLPMLAKQYNSNVSEAILRLGFLADEVQSLIESLVFEIYERAIRRQTSECVEIDPLGLISQPKYLLRELLSFIWRNQSWPMQAMGFEEWEQLAQMILDSNAASAESVRTSKKQCFPGNVQAEMRDGLFCLTRFEV